MNPKRKPGVEAQDLPDGSALLYDTVAAVAYPVTETAALAWRECDGSHSVEQIIEKLHSQFEADRQTIAEDVRNFVADLQSRGLLEASAEE